MTREEIESGNALIANFMGLESEMAEDFGGNEYLAWYQKGGSKVYDGHSIPYHSSWNWLIPVVEKIETGNYGFKMCRKVVEIYYDDSKEIILKVKEKSRIDSLYKAIVEFIKLQNNEIKH